MCLLLGYHARLHFDSDVRRVSPHASESLSIFQLYPLDKYGYVLVLKEDLTAAKVFTALSLFNMLIGPLNAFPWVVNGLV